MHIETKTVNPYTLTAHIELDAAELGRYVDEAKKRITREVTVEGFRKGKAPQHLVEKQVQPDVVRSEALELALEGSFSDAVQKESWDVQRTSELKVERNDATGLRYALQIHLWPSFTLPDLSQIQIPAKAVVVSDAEIDEALDTVRNMRATFLDKTGPVTEGDRCEVDFDATVGGVAVEGGSSRNHPLVIGGKNFMPGFEEALVGLATGDTKQFSLNAPADYYEKKLAGKTVDFTVTMRRVQAVLKPAADDAFAASLGSFASLAQLRDSLRDGIAKEKNVKEQQRLRLAIMDAVIEKAAVPAPDDMTKEELDDMIHRFGHDLQERGTDLSMYLARMKKTDEDLRKDWKPEAQRQIRIRLVLREVAKQEKISVSTQELDTALNETVAELIRQGRATEDQTDPQRIRSALMERILTDRTFEYLEKTCAVR
jgi:trigger factor